MVEQVTAIIETELAPKRISFCEKSPTKAHHLLLKSPEGEFSEGKCKYCGVTDLFRNSSKAYDWDSENNNNRFFPRFRRDSPSENSPELDSYD